MTLGLDSEAATSAALYYALNSTLVAGGLFLLADLIARERGVQARLDREQTVARPALLGTLFFVGAVGVAGLPPLAGFAAKLYILQSAFLHPAASWVFSVVLLSGLLVIVALSRAGSALFWRSGDTAVLQGTFRPATDRRHDAAAVRHRGSHAGGWYCNGFYPGHRGTACRPYGLHRCRPVKPESSPVPVRGCRKRL